MTVKVLAFWGAAGGEGGGEAGTPGTNGWSPVLSAEADGERRVLRVIDWTGGSGTKPAAGRYVGAGGLVLAAADALDVRGQAGQDGAPGTPGTPGADGGDGSNGLSVELQKTATHIQWRQTGGEWFDLVLLDDLKGEPGEPGPSGGGGSGGREVLTADRTYFVATNGSDANDGLTAGAPFATIQKALDVVGALDVSIFDATIKIADGIYQENLVAREFVGAGVCRIEGNIAAPANVSIAPASGVALSLTVPKRFDVRGIKTSSPDAGTISAAHGARVTGQDFEIGQAGTWGNGISVESGAVFTVTGPYRISGGGWHHVRAAVGGQFKMTAAATVTIVGPLGFTGSGGFAGAAHCGVVYYYNATFANGFYVTGPRYNAQTNGVVFVNYLGATYLPGSASGITATGGQFQ